MKKKKRKVKEFIKKGRGYHPHTPTKLYPVCKKCGSGEIEEIITAEEAEKIIKNLTTKKNNKGKKEELVKLVEKLINRFNGGYVQGGHETTIVLILKFEKAYLCTNCGNNNVEHIKGETIGYGDIWSTIGFECDSEDDISVSEEKLIEGLCIRFNTTIKAARETVLRIEKDGLIKKKGNRYYIV